MIYWPDLGSTVEGWNYTQDGLLLLKLNHNVPVLQVTVAPQ